MAKRQRQWRWIISKPRTSVPENAARFSQIAATTQWNVQRYKHQQPQQQCQEQPQQESRQKHVQRQPKQCAAARGLMPVGGLLPPRRPRLSGQLPRSRRLVVQRLRVPGGAFEAYDVSCVCHPAPHLPHVRLAAPLCLPPCSCCVLASVCPRACHRRRQAPTSCSWRLHPSAPLGFPFSHRRRRCLSPCRRCSTPLAVTTPTRSFIHVASRLAQCRRHAITREPLSTKPGDFGGDTVEAITGRFGDRLRCRRKHSGQHSAAHQRARRCRAGEAGGGRFSTRCEAQRQYTSPSRRSPYNIPLHDCKLPRRHREAQGKIGGVGYKASRGPCIEFTRSACGHCSGAEESRRTRGLSSRDGPAMGRRRRSRGRELAYTLGRCSSRACAGAGGSRFSTDWRATQRWRPHRWQFDDFARRPPSPSTAPRTGCSIYPSPHSPPRADITCGRDGQNTTFTCTDDCRPLSAARRRFTARLAHPPTLPPRMCDTGWRNCMGTSIRRHNTGTYQPAPPVPNRSHRCGVETAGSRCRRALSSSRCSSRHVGTAIGGAALSSSSICHHGHGCATSTGHEAASRRGGIDRSWSSPEADQGRRNFFSTTNCTERDRCRQNAFGRIFFVATILIRLPLLAASTLLPSVTAALNLPPLSPSPEIVQRCLAFDTLPTHTCFFPSTAATPRTAHCRSSPTQFRHTHQHIARQLVQTFAQSSCGCCIRPVHYAFIDPQQLQRRPSTCTALECTESLHSEACSASSRGGYHGSVSYTMLSCITIAISMSFEPSVRETGLCCAPVTRELAPRCLELARRRVLHDIRAVRSLTIAFPLTVASTVTSTALPLPYHRGSNCLSLQPCLTPPNAPSTMLLHFRLRAHVHHSDLLQSQVLAAVLLVGPSAALTAPTLGPPQEIRFRQPRQPNRAPSRLVACLACLSVCIALGTMGTQGNRHEPSQHDRCQQPRRYCRSCRRIGKRRYPSVSRRQLSIRRVARNIPCSMTLHTLASHLSSRHSCPLFFACPPSCHRHAYVLPSPTQRCVRKHLRVQLHTGEHVASAHRRCHRVIFFYTIKSSILSTWSATTARRVSTWSATTARRS